MDHTDVLVWLRGNRDDQFNERPMVCRHDGYSGWCFPGVGGLRASHWKDAPLSPDSPNDRPGGRMTVYGISGGPIEQFREGWAIIFPLHKPHYYRRRDLTRRFLSLCGIVRDLSAAHPGINPLAPGVFMIERCKRCSATHTIDAATEQTAHSGGTEHGR